MGNGTGQNGNICTLPPPSVSLRQHNPSRTPTNAHNNENHPIPRKPAAHEHLHRQQLHAQPPHHASHRVASHRIPPAFHDDTHARHPRAHSRSQPPDPLEVKARYGMRCGCGAGMHDGWTWRQCCSTTSGSTGRLEGEGVRHVRC